MLLTYRNGTDWIIALQSVTLESDERIQTAERQTGVTTIENDRFYPVTEVAELIGVNYRTALKEIHSGRLHAVPVGPKPIYRVPGWALRNYQTGCAPQPVVAAG